MLGRRAFLNSIAGAWLPRVSQGSADLRGALAAVRAGRLGALRFCRASSPEGLRLVHEVLGETGPASLAGRAAPAGARATLRYRDCVVSYSEHAGDALAAFLGSRATLTVTAAGYQIHPSMAAREASR